MKFCRQAFLVARKAVEGYCDIHTWSYSKTSDLVGILRLWKQCCDKRANCTKASKGGEHETMEDVVLKIFWSDARMEQQSFIFRPTKMLQWGDIIAPTLLSVAQNPRQILRYCTGKISAPYTKQHMNALAIPNLAKSQTTRYVVGWLSRTGQSYPVRKQGSKGCCSIPGTLSRHALGYSEAIEPSDNFFVFIFFIQHTVVFTPQYIHHL